MEYELHQPHVTPILALAVLASVLAGCSSTDLRDSEDFNGSPNLLTLVCVRPDYTLSQDGWWPYSHEGLRFRHSFDHVGLHRHRAATVVRDEGEADVELAQAAGDCLLGTSVCLMNHDAVGDDHFSWAVVVGSRTRSLEEALASAPEDCYVVLLFAGTEPPDLDLVVTHLDRVESSLKDGAGTFRLTFSALSNAGHFQGGRFTLTGSLGGKVPDGRIPVRLKK